MEQDHIQLAMMTVEIYPSILLTKISLHIDHRKNWKTKVLMTTTTMQIMRQWLLIEYSNGQFTVAISMNSTKIRNKLLLKYRQAIKEYSLFRTQEICQLTLKEYRLMKQVANLEMSKLKTVNHLPSSQVNNTGCALPSILISQLLS